MRRRSVLAGVGVVLTGVAGCLGDVGSPTGNGTTDGTPTPTSTTGSAVDPSTLDGHVRPDGDPETVPDELVCGDEEFERRGQWADPDGIQWGEIHDDDGSPVFALRVDALAVRRGESVTVTLTNVSGEEQETGNIHKSNLEVYTEAGWQVTRGWMDSPGGVHDDWWVWDPGESHDVTFEITDGEIIERDDIAHGGQLVACPDPPLGRYRFVTAAPDSGDVAAAFDLTG